MEGRDIEVCHRLLLSWNTKSDDKRVIVKFFNRKTRKHCWRIKNESVVKTSESYMSLTNFLSLSLFVHTMYIYGVNAGICNGKERYTMFFALVAMSAQNYRRLESQLKSIISRILLTSLQTQILKIFVNITFGLYKTSSLSHFLLWSHLYSFPAKAHQATRSLF